MPGADAPNCQFWPYYDTVTGEKRIGIKTIREVTTGQELLVDYGGKYLAADSSDDSDTCTSSRGRGVRVQAQDQEAQTAQGRVSAEPRAPAGGTPDPAL